MSRLIPLRRSRRPHPPEHPPDHEMTVVEHLTELRRVLIISGGAWMIATVGAFVFHERLLALLEHPIRTALPDKLPVVLGVTDTLTIPLKISAYAGFIVALPVILWQVWSFIKPGLRPVERRFAGPFIASALGLFALGALFAYFVMPIGLKFLATFLGDQANFTPELTSYISFFALLILIFGITFELPIVIVLLGLLGIVSSRMLRAKRKVIIFGIIFISFLITPGADPFTPTALAVPLLIFFEGSILLLDRVFKR